MRISSISCLRRIINSNYHPFSVIPKPDIWLKRERTNRFTAWQYASERTTSKGAERKLNKMFHYLDMQRQDEKKLEKHYARERLDAALEEHGMEYKHFRNMLDQAHILLDNVVLSQLAIYEPRTFESLVHLTRGMAASSGRDVAPPPSDVQIEPSLFREPFEKGLQFPRGPAQNHTVPPRKIRPSEY